MSSPWGKIQDTTKLVRGIAWVSTASHGGLRISKSKAESMLSESARKRAICTKSYYWWEEDCAYAIPFWELRELLATARDIGERLGPFRGATLNSKTGGSCAEEHLHLTLSRWFPEYLLERGDKPDPERLAEWQADQLYYKMRAEKHPDLITGAFGEGNRCKVWTADGKEHYVTTASYSARTQRKGPNLLSNCERS
jgi:hypothetical protein